ncbi:MAG: CopG family transcriptional regulator [Cellulomonadaceae bacterium]|jgi:hypothetical protein|nr:CopG family transcriptional regulator [Cellulomonadaceae bacterium]
MTSGITTENGTYLTAAQLDALFERAENGEFLAGQRGTTRMGRPLAVGTDTAKPFTFRLDSARRMKLNRLAQRQNTSTAAVLRAFIDAA